MTVAEIATAIKTANPSIHAVERWSASDVPTSITIETTLATIKILRVKSSRASQKSSKNPGGIFTNF